MEETPDPEVPASESITGGKYGFEDDSACGDLGVLSWVNESSVRYPVPIDDVEGNPNCLKASLRNDGRELLCGSPCVSGREVRPRNRRSKQRESAFASFRGPHLYRKRLV